MLLLFSIIIPPILGESRSPENMSWLGISGPNVWDTNFYLSWVRQATTGRFFLSYNYSIEPGSGFIHFPWYILGRILNWSGWSVSILLTIYFCIIAVLLVFFLNREASTNLPSPAMTIWVLLTALLPTGFGYLAYFHKHSSQPIELLHIEGTLWPALTSEMLIPLGALLFLILMSTYSRGQQIHHWRGTILPCIILLLLTGTQPDLAITAISSLLLYTILVQSGSKPGRVSLIILPSLVLLSYLGWLLIKTPVFLSYQFHPLGWVETVTPLTLLHLWGFPFILSVISIFLIFKNREPTWWKLLSCWLVTIVVISLLPSSSLTLSLKNHSLIGGGIPVAFLAVRLPEFLKDTRITKHLATGLLLFSIITGSVHGVLLLKGEFFPTPRPWPAGHYIPSTLTATFDYINSRLPRDSIILSDESTSNLIPRFTLCRTVWGVDPVPDKSQPTVFNIPKYDYVLLLQGNQRPGLDLSSLRDTREFVLLFRLDDERDPDNTVWIFEKRSDP